MVHTRYEDPYFYYIWKPHNIGSTWGKTESILDYIQNRTHESPIQKIGDFLAKERTAQEEYGLVNRLDNDTAGLLYFAKNHAIKDRYKQKQQEEKIYKHYIAAIRWYPNRQTKTIAYPIRHHPTQKERMETIKDDITWWKPYITYIENIWYNTDTNKTYLHIIIQRGARHQIRCHLASIGCPLIGEKIYKNKKDEEKLHLRSIGLQIE